MDHSHQRAALQSAITAARAAGEVMRRNLRATKKINVATQHDIKLELDVRCQKLIERQLTRNGPAIPILGEEGISGDPEAERRWVVDPIDGTVNFTYGIPHACVSIALQVRIPPARGSRRASPQRRLGAEERASGFGDFRSVVGVVYDPFCDELWTAIRGQRSLLNGRPIAASRRSKLAESIVALGFAKERATLDKMLPTLDTLIHRVRKIRIMGAAGLSLVYVACGRMDAYVEYGLRLWDIAAGSLIIEGAGGSFWSEPVNRNYTYQIVASNRPLARKLRNICR